MSLAPNTRVRENLDEIENKTKAAEMSVVAHGKRDQKLKFEIKTNHFESRQQQNKNWPKKRQENITRSLPSPELIVACAHCAYRHRVNNTECPMS